VAKVDAVFDTTKGAYTATGKAGNVSFRGSVSDITQPFTITGDDG
jgi:hypothetical protein